MEKRNIVVVGAGGLGCAVLPLLAARGMEVTVFDDDRVSLSNLQRQILFRTEDVGRPKVEVAVERVLALVPGARIRGVNGRLDTETALEEVARSSLVMDGSDNLPTRFLMNDACVLAKKPLVHGGILRFLGQVLAVLPGRTACYRCIFEDLPPAGAVPSCAEAGVMGTLCGIVGARMVQEAVKILDGSEAGDRLWTYDAKAGRSRYVEVGRDERCAVCGDEASIETLLSKNYQEAA